MFATVLLPVGFIVYEHVSGAGDKALIQLAEVEMNDVHWSQPAYTGVVVFKARVKNKSAYKLTNLDLKLTVSEPGQPSEVLSDTIKVAVSSGEEESIKQYCARPTFGRDVSNFLQMRQGFDERAGLRWEVTAAQGVAE